MDAIRALVGVVVTTAVLAVPAAANAEIVNNLAGPPVNVLDDQVGSPYPSSLTIAGADGPVIDVNVFLLIKHERPDDLDILLVSPDRAAVRLMTDACANADMDAIITFDDEAADQLPTNNCTVGTFRPTPIGSSSFPAPAPNGSTDELSGFDGRDPNGHWELYVVDDAGVGDTGLIDGWGVQVTTQAAEIAVPGGPGSSGIASTYPSTRTVPIPDGQVISDVDLALPDFNHSFPADVDMLLQGPGGASVMVMSDACSDGDMHGRELLFSDQGGLFTETNSNNCNQLLSAQPVDFGSPQEDLPAPAPPRPYASSLSAFNGLQGTDWRLWVSDDTNGDTGYIEGWNPVLTTRPATATGFAATTATAAEGQTASLTVTRSPLPDLGPATLGIDIGPSGTDASDLGPAPTQLQFARGETSKTINVPINSDFESEGAEDFVVSLANPVDDALLSDATSFAVVTIAASPPDNRFTIGDVERLPNGRAKVTVTIPNPGVLKAVDAGPKELLKPTELNAEKAGTSVLTLKPSKPAKRKLKRGKKVKLTAQITYTPEGGTANSAEAPVKLKRKRS